MAQSSERNRLNVTIRKDIKIPNFSSGRQQNTTVTFHHDETEPFFNVQVYPRGRVPDHVSLMVSRCWFYPHFISGVVYDSLGWTACVLNVEGEERFHAYFGGEDFLSLDWAEDFFEDHAFGLEKFLKLSVLLDDPEEFLPNDVLTVRCEVFYECDTGDVAMQTRGEEINKFLVKGFVTKMAQPNPDDDEAVSHAIGGSEDTRTPVSYDAKSCQKSIRLMEESFDELGEAFALYTKLQLLKDVSEQNPQLRSESGESTSQPDKDFSQDIEKAGEVFKTLRERDANVITKVEEVKDSEGSKPNMVWWDERYGVEKVTHQLVRLVVLNKHLQLRFENCKRWYKEAGEKLKLERDFDTGRSTDGYTMEEEIKELFFLYNEIRKMEADRKPNEDNLRHVSRFLTIFINTLRVLALRLYWPVCVLQAPPSATYPSTGDNEIEQDTQDNSSTTQKMSPVEESPISNSISEMISEETAPRLVAGNSGEKWIFTIETSDGQQLEVPFQEDQITLGSRLRAASPVFDRMLETPMMEKAQKKLKLDDIDYNTLCHFIAFIQTDKITTETLDDCCLLYKMAHKYQVSSLLIACGERISELMTHLNVEEVGSFSKFFEDDALITLVEAHCFRPRATIAVLGLQDLNVTPLSSDTTSALAIADIPIVEKATEAIVPKQNYDFYN